MEAGTPQGIFHILSGQMVDFGGCFVVLLVFNSLNIQTC